MNDPNFDVTLQPTDFSRPWGETSPRNTSGPDMMNDGAVVDDRRATPTGGAPEFAGQDVLEVNGIGTDLGTQETQIRALEQALHQHVTGIHVGTLGSRNADLVGALPQEKFDTRIDDVVPEKVLHDRVASDLAAGKPVHIIAHSRGALVTQRALEKVYGDMQARGMSEKDIQSQMSRVTVETFGGAAKSFPPGVRNVDYVDHDDPIPNLFGKGTPNLDADRVLGGSISPNSALQNLGSAMISEVLDAPMLMMRGVGRSSADTIVNVPPTVDGRHSATAAQVEDGIEHNPSGMLKNNHDFFWYLAHRENFGNTIAGNEQFGNSIER